MSDTLERRLRESMERGAERMTVEPRAPERVLRRARRRQTGTILVAAAAAAVVALGSFVAVKEFWTSSGGKPATNGNLTSSTVGGVTVTYPAAWTFESGRQTAALAGGSDQLPIFALDSETPAVPIFSGEGAKICTPTSVILGVLEQHGVTPGDAPPPPAWPVALQRDAAREGSDGCGQFWSAEWGAAGRHFLGYLRVGAQAPESDRTAAFDGFLSMEFGPDPSPPSIAPTAPSVSKSAWVSQGGPGSGIEGTTIATGTANGQDWKLVAGQDHGDIALEVQYADGSSGIGGFLVPDESVMEFTYALATTSDQAAPTGDVVILGAAAKDVAGIETSPTGARARIVAMPADLDAPFNAFVLVASADKDREIVAYDERGNELDRQHLGGFAGGPGVAPPAVPECTPVSAEAKQKGAAACGGSASAAPRG